MTTAGLMLYQENPAFDQSKVFFTNLPDTPFGMEKIVWNDQQNQFVKAWVNQDISCPNGIPSYSAASDMVYCIGQRNGSWTLEGVDWSSGENLGFLNLGYLPKYNSSYAGAQIGYSGQIVTGAIGGVLSIQ